MAIVPGFAKVWRIIEMDNWDNDLLDLVEKAHLAFEVGPMVKSSSMR
jgi:hypothetical protein